MTPQQQKLLLQNERFIYAKAIEFWKRNPDLDRDDCKSEAMLVACELVKVFDPSFGAHFTTFITRKIQWRLLDFARDQRKVPSVGDSGVDLVSFEKDIEDHIDDKRLRNTDSVVSKRLIGHSVHDIAKAEGVDRSTVFRRQQQELTELRNKLKA